MTFKSNPVALGNASTEIFTCPAGLEAAVILTFDVAAGATWSLLFYDAALNQEFAIASAKNLEAFPKSILMSAGDKLSGLRAGGAVTVFAGVYHDGIPVSAYGFFPAGAYTPGTTYGIGDVVSYNGSSYASRIMGNVGNVPSASPAQWQIISEKGNPGQNGQTFVWAGNYNPATAYPVQRVVRSGGATWNSLQAATGNAPPALPTEANAFWAMFVRDAQAGSWNDLADKPAYLTKAAAGGYGAGTANVLLTPDVVWGDADPVIANGVTGNFNLDLSKINHEIIATGNFVFNSFTNAKPGQSGNIEVVHSGGGRTASVNTAANLGTPESKGLTLSNAAAARDLLGYYVKNNGQVVIYVSMLGV